MRRSPIVTPSAVGPDGSPFCPECGRAMRLNHGANLETGLEVLWWVCRCGAATHSVPIPHFIARALRRANAVRYAAGRDRSAGPPE